MSRSNSEQRPLRTRAPAAVAEAPRCSSSVVLPIPASPTISTTDRPAAAEVARSASSSIATSLDRPTSGLPLGAGKVDGATVPGGSYVPPAAKAHSQPLLVLFLVFLPFFFAAGTFTAKRAAVPWSAALVEPVMVTVSFVPAGGRPINVVE